MFKSLVIISLIFHMVHGHGMLMDPVNRSSRWRVDKSAPTNYDDNAISCGGRSTQWDQNGGRCGFCGDNFKDKTPRSNELNGRFGQGVIVKSYLSGAVMPVKARITANHLGYFTFRLCNLDTFKTESDACFNSILMTQPNGDTQFYIGRQTGDINLSLQIPDKVHCEHCVLQWTYTAGNSWGPCGNGTGAVGCGPQETFRTCSDISIV